MRHRRKGVEILKVILFETNNENINSPLFNFYDT